MHIAFDELDNLGVTVTLHEKALAYAIARRVRHRQTWRQSDQAFAELLGRKAPCNGVAVVAVPRFNRLLLLEDVYRSRHFFWSPMTVAVPPYPALGGRPRGESPPFLAINPN